jgi:hypothetical protein
MLPAPGCLSRYKDGLDGRKTGLGLLAGDFPRLHSVQTGSGAPPASRAMGTWGPFCGIEAPEV